jgi:nitroimidazol reductase NimA-like FMN-containing flavoprotein (pyridoxamine 5'-phosphate oxidase superfamily)
MIREVPLAELDSRFSSPGATALAWTKAENQLQRSGVYWLATVRPEGRPHVAPLLAVWVDGALYFSTGETERKAQNLAQNAQVVITTGCQALTDEVDVVVEGEAMLVHDDAKLRRVGDAYAAKYGEAWRLPAIDGVVVFEVTPTKVFGFGRGDAKGPPPDGGFNQTRWRFTP